MPKIISATPSWLRRPSPGSELFNPLPDAKLTKPAGPGPRRTIARKDTQVFVAVGNQIRWADLALLQFQWKERQDKQIKQQRRRPKDETPDDAEIDGDHEDSDIASYRLLKVSVWEDIRQLTISPNGSLIAILTSHTAHIAILPDPSHLRGPDAGPIRLKTYTVGPTCHVLSQSPVMSAIWHPLGVLGNCLVTVTAEAIVRVWEFDIGNRWSFDSPSVTVDLKRLADGLPPDPNPAASKLCANRAFSPDSFEMEVAAACFGGGRSGDQIGWAPMTLWIAMREGDVYALCPLLPVKWSPPSTLLPSLAVLVELNRLLAENDTSDRRQIIEKQQEWIIDINNQEPLVKTLGLDSDEQTVIYSRPDKPQRVPSLQGPFELYLMPEEDVDEDVEILLTDIHAIGARLDPEDVFNDRDEGPEWGMQGSECLSVGVVCLLTNTGRVHVLLDVEGIEGQWVSSEEGDSSEADNEPPSLLHFESIDVTRADENRNLDLSWPLFSHDPCSEYSIFVTHPRGVTHLSFSMWVESLEDELRNGGSIGVDLRLDVILKSTNTIRRRVLDWNEKPEVFEHPQSVTASVIFKDTALGYFLLTSTNAGPSAVLFDFPYANGLDNNGALALQEYEPDTKELVLSERRAAYEPALVFSTESPLASFLESRAHGRLVRSMTEEIRFSQSTLSLLTEAHRILSVHMHALGSAAGELFRQCERMQREFSEQIRNVNEALHRVEDVIGEDDDDTGLAMRGEKGIQRRIEEAKAKQGELVHRFDALERKVALSGGQELSDKEKAWISELQSVEALILEPEDEEEVGEDEEDDSAGGKEEMALWKRHQEIKRLTRQLVTEIQNTTNTSTSDPSSPTPSKQASTPLPRAGTTPPSTTKKEEVKVPSFIRKQKIQQVMRLLERESALVDATKERLERLSIVS